MIGLRLLEDALGASVIEEHQMEQRRQPGREPPAPAKSVLSNNHVTTAVVVTGIAESAYQILLRPVVSK